jgi:hypothetical protein
MRWRLPAPVTGEVVLASRRSLLLVGGLDSAGASTSRVSNIDPSTGRVSSEGTLAAPLHDAAGAVLRGRAFLFGGGDTSTSSDVQKLIPGATARPAGSLPTPRSDLAAAVLGGRAYVLGGYDGTSPSPEVLATADGSDFVSVARLPIPVRYTALAASGGRLYAFGGETGRGSPTGRIQQIDPTKGQASVVGTLPAPTDHASAVVLGGSVYVIGGDVAGVPSRRILSFEPDSGAVRVAGRLPIAIADAASAVVAGNAYLVGGIDASGATSDQVIRLAVVSRAGAPQGVGSASARR